MDTVDIAFFIMIGLLFLVCLGIAGSRWYMKRRTPEMITWELPRGVKGSALIPNKVIMQPDFDIIPIVETLHARAKAVEGEMGIYVQNVPEGIMLMWEPFFDPEDI